MKNSRSIGLALVVTLLVLAGFSVGIGVGCVYHNEIKEAVENMFSSVGGNVRLPQHEIDYAKNNLRKLLSSAQDSFVHRQVGSYHMAASVDELGNGFNGNGALIYNDIWIARYGRDFSTDKHGDAECEKKILSRPYRYAILPVKGVLSEKEDALTTCIIAIPVAENQAPVLVMIAGPIRNDPFDFRKEWGILEVSDNAQMRAVRLQIESARAVDKSFMELVTKRKEVRK